MYLVYLIVILLCNAVIYTCTAMHTQKELQELAALACVLEHDTTLLYLQDMHGYTALHRAIMQGRTDKALALIHATKKYLNPTNQSFFVNNNLLDIQDHEGRTALHHAIIQGNLDLACSLLDAGSDAFIFDNKHTNAIDCAYMYEQPELASYMVIFVCDNANLYTRPILTPEINSYTTRTTLPLFDRATGQWAMKDFRYFKN